MRTAVLTSRLGSLVRTGTLARYQHHAQMVPHKSSECMRHLRHLRQLPQILLNYCGGGSVMHVVFQSCARVRARQPLAQFNFAEAPLPSDFDGGDFPAFGPKADSARRDSQPFGYCRGRQEWFTILLQLFHSQDASRFLEIRKTRSSGRGTRRSTGAPFGPQNLMATKQQPVQSRLQSRRFLERCQVTVALTKMFFRYSGRPKQFYFQSGQIVAPWPSIATRYRYEI